MPPKMVESVSTSGLPRCIKAKGTAWIKIAGPGPKTCARPKSINPRHTNSQEAQELLRRRGGFLVNDQLECYKTLRLLLNDPKARTAAGNISLKLVKENIGATARFIEHLEKVL